MKKHFYGGQAVIEGVMIRGLKNCVVAVRNTQNEIIINEIKIPSFSKSIYKKIPFFRGVIILVEMMVIGYRSLTKSSEIVEESEEGELSNLEKVFSYIFSSAFLIIVLSLSFNLCAQISSDRPDQTESSLVLSKSSIQIESGLSFQKDQRVHCKDPYPYRMEFSLALLRKVWHILFSLLYKPPVYL